MEDVEALSCEFKNSFRDFDRLKPNLYMYNNPMEANVEHNNKKFSWNSASFKSCPNLVPKKKRNARELLEIGKYMCVIVRFLL